MTKETDLFKPHIAGNLGKTAEETKKLQKVLDDFGPTAKVKQDEKKLFGGLGKSCKFMCKAVRIRRKLRFYSDNTHLGG